MCDDEEEEETGVDRDNMRYLNTIYHGAGWAAGYQVSLPPGYFLSADAVTVRTRTSLQSDQI